ncbi:unnamed protein product [Rotaria sordida]|uniref:Uncharacterized protein n=1 Tax=Rotaria sordida TaxID=392033 RepID=A0A813Y2G2_9BILA|nr:unnamed protein product [Rotaria sordida]CAF1159822.1 unnamed protein product [Rotaria sordida]CAF1258616.1 unnamed protein product [Rotaria sordida]CAF1332511.1 unnamed protein product [Rotaria sordida]CAF1333843.1 unnamed protein product [Rotaria sordida]
MSTFFVFSLSFLISSILFISCSPIYRPLYISSYEENDKPYYGQLISDENDYIPLMIYPKHASIHHFQRSLSNYPRTSRNSWFRVSTYQHMKPTVESEEKSAGDNLMRWG